MAIFGAWSLHPEIPFPAAGVERQARPYLRSCPRFCAAAIRDFGPVLWLVRIEPERLKLPTPFRRWVAEPLDANAAGQAAFYGCLDQVRSEKSK